MTATGRVRHCSAAARRGKRCDRVGAPCGTAQAATKHQIPVGNTPGVLTETTAEIAAALTMAAARRVVEADTFMRGGKYKGWLPTLFVGELLQNKTVGIIGAGRIGSAYARMMVEARGCSPRTDEPPRASPQPPGSCAGPQDGPGVL